MKELFEGLSVTLTEADLALVSERLEAHNKEIQEGVKNDSEFIDKTKAEEAGRIYGSLERVLGRSFSELEMDKYKDLSGVKKFTAVIKDGIASLSETKDKTSQEWQQKWSEVNEEFKKYKEDEVPALLEGERNGFYKDFTGSKMLEDSLGFETTINTEFRVPTIETYAHKMGYSAKWDAEKKDYEFFLKDGVKPTEDGKVLEKKDIIKKAFEVAGVLKKNNGTPEDAKKPGELARPKGKLSPAAQRMLDTMTVD